MSVYRLPSPYERAPVSRRLSGFGLALAINLALLLILMTLGIIPPPSQKTLRGVVVDLIPQENSAPTPSRKTQQQRQKVETNRPVPKPPPIILPVKPTIAPPPQPTKKPTPWIELSSQLSLIHI